MGREQVGLTTRPRGAHEADHGVAGLMDRNRVEESFDDDDGSRVPGDRAMEVEEDERLSEASWKSVLRLAAINGAAGVRDQLAR
jgi:hypothetical protein